METNKNLCDACWEAADKFCEKRNLVKEEECKGTYVRFLAICKFLHNEERKKQCQK